MASLGGLLVCVGEVRRPRPAAMRQLGDALGVVGQPADAPVELLEGPRRRVAARDVLHVEDPRVEEGAVHLLGLGLGLA